MNKCVILYKKLIYMCLILTVLCLTGCNYSEKTDSDFKVFYPDKESVKVSAVAYTPDSEDRDTLLNECIILLSEQPDDMELRPAISTKDELTLATVDEEGIVYLDFKGSYYKLEHREEIIKRAAIVRTLMQIDGIEGIIFNVEGAPLTDSKSQPIGIMTADMFIDNAGKEINSYERTKLVLYFANEDGTGLYKTTEAVAYSSNISLEKLVTEHLISGPLSKGVYPVTGQDVGIMAVTTKDGVCYVNVSKEFLVKQGKLTDEVVLYSFVNSLTELPNINKVQFMIDGETEISFGDHSYLNAPYERNLDIVID